jgi:hypothetical protein
VLAIASYWIPKVAPPASWWFEVHELHVSDADAGEPVLLRYTRSIHRPFRADWIVSVRVVSADRAQEVCVGSASSLYRPDAALPAVADLEWFTAGACPALAPGTYRVETHWRLRLGWPWGERAVTARSNVFVVGDA